MSAKRRHKFSSPHLNFVVGVEFEIEVEVELDIETQSGMGRTDATHTYMLLANCL